MLQLNGTICPFCKGKNLLRFSAAAHDAVARKVNIVECRSCQAAWQWPLQRTETQSVSEFESAYRNQHDRTYFDPLMRELVAICQCDFLRIKAPNVGNLLDIGCGDGTFAKQMGMRGWNVVGLDPTLRSEETIKWASGSCRLVPGGVAELQEVETFDLITLWDVVEHVERPDELIAEAVKRLVPGGVLIVETGNFQSAGRIEGGQTWWNYQIDHRWYLAPPQLGELMEKAGIYDREIADRVLRPWWKGQAKMMPPKLGSLVKSIAKDPRRVTTELRRHKQLSQGFNDWGKWGGMEIMTMVGVKN